MTVACARGIPAALYFALVPEGCWGAQTAVWASVFLITDTHTIFTAIAVSIAGGVITTEDLARLPKKLCVAHCAIGTRKAMSARALTTREAATMRTAGCVPTALHPTCSMSDTTGANITRGPRKS